MKVMLNGQEVELAVAPDGAEISTGADRLYVRTATGTQSALVVKHRGQTLISLGGRTYTIEPVQASRGKTGSAASGKFTSPMPGLIVDVLVSQGETVVKGTKLLVLEAMKTQQPILAPFDGVVAELSVEKGQQVKEGAPLVRLEPTKSDEVSDS